MEISSLKFFYTTNILNKYYLIICLNNKHMILKNAFDKNYL